MVDFYLRYLLPSSNEITDEELMVLDDNAERFISNLTPIAQRLSSSTN
jgi:hypothetical protein